MLTKIYKLTKAVRRLQAKKKQGEALSVAEEAYLQIAKQDLQAECASTIAEYTAEGVCFAVLLWCCGLTGLWAALFFSVLVRVMFWFWNKKGWW